MRHPKEEIARSLRAARERRGLSQRVLSGKSGLTQAQISRIENGVLDPRVSTLVELARVLGLELQLVPRTAVPAIRSIVRGSLGLDPASSATRPAYDLDALDNG